MAIINSYVLGECKNSVGNVTLYKNKKQIARGKSMFVKNPKTLAQRQQRLKMTTLVRLSKTWMAALMKGYPGSNLSEAQCKFVQKNMPAITVDEEMETTLNIEQFSCSAGPIAVPKVTASGSSASNSITFQVEQKSLIPMYNEGTDTLYAVAYEKALEELEIVELGKRGDDNWSEFTVPAHWDKDNLVLLAFALDKTGKRASDTAHVELTLE